jgi:23S rRNA pseudouridine1911/1915/1917 synthase
VTAKITPRQVVIPAEAAGQRLDTVLAGLLGVTRSQLQKSLVAGLVTLDGVPVMARQTAIGGARVTVAIAPVEAEPTVPELPILYEDDDVMVVDKPAGLVVHASESGRVQPTVAAFAAAHGVIDSDTERPGIVHRLDKDTSGLLVLAKNPAAKADLQRQFKARTVAKTYLALVRGRLTESEAVIRLPIGRSRSQPMKRAVVPGMRASETAYKVVREYPGATLVQVELHTGRTHQIRVHFSHLGHPVMGDTLYGDRQRPTELHRQFLHAAKLGFRTPSGRQVQVESPLPADLEAFLTHLETRV